MKFYSNSTYVNVYCQDELVIFSGVTFEKKKTKPQKKDKIELYKRKMKKY